MCIILSGGGEVRDYVRSLTRSVKNILQEQFQNAEISVGEKLVKPFSFGIRKLLNFSRALKSLINYPTTSLPQLSNKQFFNDENHVSRKLHRAN